ncbi:MAG TPA: hypothetical protein VG692_19190 [Gemmatimonadales bacterium]|nr:hypothetical protein [Gemmatimonadales bacterium]
MTAPVTSTPLPRWKRLLFSLILLGIVLAVGEGIASVYLRVTRGYDGKHLYQYDFDPYKNILPAPNYVDTRGIRHNSQGFRRDTEVSREKPAGTYRIFLMGASTAYGLGGLWPHLQKTYAVLKNSETIDAYLQQDLQARFPDRKIEVINAAITSTWTHHELIYLNQTILRYHPDMVLFLDGFNDFYFTNPGHDQFADYSYNLQSRVIMGDPTLRSLVYQNFWWLFRKSALAHVIGRGLRVVKLVLSPRPKRGVMDVERDMASMRQVFPENALKMQRRMALILRDEKVVPVFMLQPMLALERDHKPMSAMEQKLFDFNISSYAVNYEPWVHQARDFVVQQETAMTTELGAHFIDLTGIYAGVPDQIYTDYCHLTPLGNQMLAKYVAGRIIPLIQPDSAAKP